MRKKNKNLVIAVVLMVLTSSILLGAGARSAALRAEVTPDSKDIIVYNHAINGEKDTLKKIDGYDSVLADVAREQAKADKGHNNFGPNAYLAAIKHIDAGDYASVKDYAKFDLEYRIKHDPYLCAAILVDYVHKIDPSDKIAKDETWQKPVGQQPNFLSDEFVKDPAYFKECADKLWKKLSENASWSIEELSDYTSSMYMFYHGRDGVRPDIVVRDSTNKGGHTVILDFGKAGKMKLRLECGYQPIDVSTYWPTPEKPPVDDDTPTPPGPEPENPPNKLEPKDPNAGPQGQIKDHKATADFGGGANDPGKTDKTETPEPKSPDAYTPPTAPSSGGNNSGNSSSSNSAADSSKSGSAIVDHDNGTTGQTSNGDSYTVQAGDGKDHTPLDQVQQSHSADTVEPAVSNDGINEGDVAPVD